MGTIRHVVLRDQPDVNGIRIVDPEVDPSAADDAEWIDREEINWDDTAAAFICTPNNVTADLCVEALEKCGNVFCEKPPGRNWEDFSRIVGTASRLPDHRLVFGFNHRLHPAVQSAKALIGDGGVGDIMYVKGTYGKSGGARYRESWRNDRDISGGGILLDQGIHMLDIFQFFLGELSLVDVVLRDSFWKCGVEDNAFVLLRSEGGVPAFLHSSATLWKHTFRLEIGCSHGYLACSGFLSRTGSYGREQLVVGRRQFEDETFALGNPREEIIHFDRDDSWRLDVDEFLASIREGRQPTLGTIDDAGMVMAIIRDVYERASCRAGVGEG